MTDLDALLVTRAIADAGLAFHARYLCVDGRARFGARYDTTSDLLRLGICLGQRGISPEAAATGWSEPVEYGRFYGWEI
jgi:hypothetical protein